jgi:hypothetical protein
MKKLFLSVLFAAPFLAAAQPSNLNFEEWDNPITSEGALNRPTGWIWSSGLYTDPAHMFSSPPATNAQSGNYALTLHVWYNYIKDMAIQQSAFTERPERLRGYYRYVENAIVGPGNITVSDTARVSILLTRWNQAAQHSDTIGFGFVDLHASEGYSEFNVAINYQSAASPDSVMLTLDPSMVKRFPDIDFEAPDDGMASYFTVDNLTLEGGTLGTNELAKTAVSVYPNPATDVLYIGDFAGTVTIRNASGETVVKDQFVSPGTGISLAGFSPGMYFPEFQSNGTVFHSNPIIKQ